MPAGFSRLCRPPKPSKSAGAIPRLKLKPAAHHAALIAAAALALLLNAGCAPTAGSPFALNTDSPFKLPTGSLFNLTGDSPFASNDESRVTLVSYKDPYFPEPIDILFAECTYETDPSGDLQITAHQRQYALARPDASPAEHARDPASPAEYTRDSAATRPSAAAQSASGTAFQPVAPAPQAASGTGFQPAPAPLERILHIHVYWQPHPGVTFSNSTTTTATIRYVLATHDGAACYTGTGFAYPTWRRDDTLELDLESANLQLDTATGDTPESLGPVRLTGKLFARRDPFRTVDLMRQADQHAAGTPLAEPPPPSSPDN